MRRKLAVRAHIERHFNDAIDTIPTRALSGFVLDVDNPSINNSFYS